MVRVCVDAMGGDEPPEVVLEGIGKALDDHEDLEVLVAGDAGVVEPFCAGRARAKALVTTEAIGMDEHPADAIRTKRDSSIVRGCEAIRAGEADAFFSAGNTGAVLAAATLKVGRIHGITRPALMTPIPGLAGHRTVTLDLGANADCKPEMLVQFAQMGSAFAHTVMGVEHPRCALMSNGTEATKGSAQVLEFHALLEEHNGEGYDFAGNCEGVDLLLGSYDVIVADGFTGNVALKTLEGTAKYMVKRIKEAVAKSPRAALGAWLLKPALSEVARDLSGDETGGAVLLGCKAPVFIGHGATSASAVYHGILAAKRAVEGGLVERIARSSEAQSQK